MRNILLFTLLTLALFSCEKNGVEESTSRFMMVHASPNTPDIEFFIDDKPILLQPLVYTSNTFYRDILSGIRNLKVVVSGSTKIDTNLNFEKDAVRSFFFYDKPLDFKMQIVDDVFAQSSGGNCRIRFFQMVPDATTVDLINTINNSVLFTNTDLGQSNGWVTVPSGLYNWELRNSVTQNSIYTDWRPDTLLAGKNYTIISNGFQNTMTFDTIGVWPISNEDFIP
jgi:hypothetical protein